MKLSITGVLSLLLVCVGLVWATPASARGFRLGAGVHYMTVLGDIKDDPNFDENAFAFIASADFKVPLVRIEGDVEFIPDYHNSSETMIQPAVYGLLGNLIYGGIGTGIGYMDKSGWQKAFFALRAGVNFDLLPRVGLDVFASYQFQDAGDLENLSGDSLDSLTFGAIAHF